MESFHYLFGPVPSRRFGRSLGVDLTPYKTCTDDCVFCQLGHTTHHTTERKEWVPADQVIQELKTWIRSGDQADYITLSGSGEPTLHSRFGEVLKAIRSLTRIPAVLLTNGSLLYLPEVRKAASCADIVKISLSAWDEVSYRMINRPHPDLGFQQLAEGSQIFRTEFNGRIWLEVFLINGMNSMPADVQKIAAVAKKIFPDRIQLNTAVRPSGHESVTPLTKEALQSLTDLFTPCAEVIAEFKSFQRTGEIQFNADKVLRMIRRRPSTIAQIAEAFGMHRNEAAKYLGQLSRSGDIRPIHQDSMLYYQAVEVTGNMDGTH